MSKKLQTRVVIADGHVQEEVGRGVAVDLGTVSSVEVGKVLVTTNADVDIPLSCVTKIVIDEEGNVLQGAGDDSKVESLEKAVADSNSKLSAATEQFTKLQRMFDKQEKELAKKNAEIEKLKSARSTKRPVKSVDPSPEE